MSDNQEIIDAQSVLKKFDKEADFRTYTGFLAKVITALAITFACFHLYTTVFGVLETACHTPGIWIDAHFFTLSNEKKLVTNKSASN